MGDLIAAHQRTFALRSPIFTSNPARIGRRGMGFCREACGSGRGHLHVAHHLVCHKSWPPSATSNEFLLTLNLMPKRFLSKNGPIFSIPAINPAVGDLIVHEFCSVLPYLSKNRFLSGVRTQKSPVAGTGRKERPQGGRRERNSVMRGSLRSASLAKVPTRPEQQVCHQRRGSR